MTGLPSPAPAPPCLPSVQAVVDAARAWLEASTACASAGDGATGALHRAAGDWQGAAATAAARRSRTLRAEAGRTSDTGLAGVIAVARFAQALRRLGIARTALRSRVGDEATALAVLVLEPDTRPDAAALRAAACARHRSLVADLRTWDADRRRAEDDLVVALGGLGARPQAATSPHDLLDRAHRALLALDDSPAGDATRQALREGGSDTWLLDFDPAAFDGDGTVAIAYGDPQGAAHVAVVVPGMTTDAMTIAEVGAMARAVSGAAAARAPRTTSTIAWIGYDAPADRDLARGRLPARDLPDVLRVAGERAAAEGGAELVRFTDGFGDRDVTVIGHSYGATTAARAAADGMDADRLVLLGSPGAGTAADDATDLRVPTWVAAHDLDPVTWVGGRGPLGADPAHADFGAVRLPTDPAEAPHLDEPGRFVGIHAGYLRPGSLTLEAVGAVVVDDDPPTTPSRTASGTRLAADWLAGQAAYELMSWR